jgi:flavin-binding protein dodecin
MADQDPRTAKLMALVETSSVREAEAATNAIERARETLQGFGSFGGYELRRRLDNGVMSASQGTLNVGVRVVDRD